MFSFASTKCNTKERFNKKNSFFIFHVFFFDVVRLNRNNKKSTKMKQKKREVEEEKEKEEA